MNESSINSKADKVVLKAGIVVFSVYVLFLMGMVVVYEHSEEVGTVCCVVGVSHERGDQGILVQVTLENGNVINSRWVEGVSIKKGNKAIFKETKNKLTSSQSYVFSRYVSDA